MNFVSKMMNFVFEMMNFAEVGPDVEAMLKKVIKLRKLNRTSWQAQATSGAAAAAATAAAAVPETGA